MILKEGMKRVQKSHVVIERHKMPEDKAKKLDLRKPVDCREFLSSITIDNRKVTKFTLVSGRELSVSEMSDSEAVQYANDLYFGLFKGKEGGGFVDTNIDRGLN